MAAPTDDLQDDIYTGDLFYTNAKGKYTFRFSYWGDGIFLVKTSGYLDEESLKEQIQAGDLARRRYKELYPNKKSHLIWDLSEVNGVSLFSRHLAFRKVNSEPSIASVTIIGANLLIASFVQIVSKLKPHLKLFLFKTFEEGLSNLRNNLPKINSTSKGIIHFSSDTVAYANFIELWQKNPNYVFFGSNKLKKLANTNWNYSAANNSYKCSIHVIEGNVVFFNVQGHAKPEDIDRTYEILANIINDLGFNPKSNKFYSILDIKNLKNVSLEARKRISYHESLLKDYSHAVIIIPSNLVSILFNILKLINLESFGHWKSVANTDDAFAAVYAHKTGLTDRLLDQTIKPTPTIEPKNLDEALQIIKSQQKEIQAIKRHQEEQIHKILEVTGRMTWDESFNVPSLTPNSKSPFNEVFNSLSILFQDFKEIIQEKTDHSQRLKESEDKYKNLIDLASDIILVYQDNSIKFVNSRVAHVMGYEPEEVIGKGMENFVFGPELDRLSEYYKRRMKGEELPWMYETEFIHKNRQKVPVSMSVGRIIYENQPAAMVIARDITHKKRTEEELERYRNHLEEIVKQRTQQLQKEITDRKFAEESDRLKSAFLSNMSHEIRTPMNAIISFSNFLKDPNIPKHQHDEFLNYIQSSGQSLMRLINDIIDISKIEAKQLSIQESITHVDPILDELYKLFDETRKKHKKTDLSLILTIPDRSRNVYLNTDPYRLRQILSNLLENAIKFTDTGYVEFGYRFDNDQIIFFVKDTGIGIPDDKADQIFRRFGKLESSDRNQSGTGLGLAISKNLSYLLKGNLWMESKEGEGSVFYFSLPCKYSGEQKVTPGTTSTVNGSNNWHGKKILIAEDEELNFKVLEIALKKTGAEIIRANNGQEAVSKATEMPDLSLVLMDIQMPIMDGYEAMRQIKQVRAGLPIIAQTAFALLEEQKKCVEMGFNDYLAKPIRTEELYAKILRHIL